VLGIRAAASGSGLSELWQSGIFGVRVNTDPRVSVDSDPKYRKASSHMKQAPGSESGSRPISRVLSRRQSVAIIHLRPSSPAACSDLPESAAGHGIAFLFGLAPGGVYLAAECCHPRGALLPHHFTLTPPPAEAAHGAVYFLLHFP
jgi:hypothetical protein